MLNKTRECDNNRCIESLDRGAKLIWGKFIVIRAGQVQVLEWSVWNSFDIVYLLQVWMGYQSTYTSLLGFESYLIKPSDQHPKVLVR